MKKRLLLFLLASAAVEIFIFNFLFFMPALNGCKPYELKIGGGAAVKGFVNSPGGWVFNDIPASVKFPPLNKKVCYVTFNIEGAATAQITPVFIDSARSLDIRAGAPFYLFPFGKKNGVPLFSEGQITSLAFSFDDVEGPLVLKSLTLNRPPFSFNLFRFFLVFAALAGFYFLKKRSFYAARLDPASKTQKMWFTRAVVYLCLFYLFLFYAATNLRLLTTAPSDNYSAMTQAFLSGRLYFKELPPPKALEAENIYDPSVHPKTGAKWDTVFYKGKYYSYLGVLPALLLFIPVKIITGHYLTPPAARLILLFAFIASFLLLYRKAVFHYFKNCGFILFTAGAFMLGAGGYLHCAMTRDDDAYTVPYLCALLFLTLAFGRLLDLHLLKKYVKRNLFLAGLFFAAVFACRPSTGLYILCAAPFLIERFKKEKNKKNIFYEILFFAAPLAAAAAALMVYNYARFDSPFQFGAVYNLTVADVRTYSFAQLWKLPAGLFSYFFQLPTVNMIFPFLHTEVLESRFTGFFYQEPVFGLISFPFLWILAFAGIMFKSLKDKVFAGFIKILLICSFAIIIFNIFMGGVLPRYFMDFAPMLFFAAALTWLAVEKDAQSETARIYITRTALVCAAVSFIVVSSLILNGDNTPYDSFAAHSPRLYLFLKQTFEFWI